MDVTLLVFTIVGFLFVFLLIEGGYLLWRNTRSDDVKKLSRRLRNLSAGQHGIEVADLLRRDSFANANVMDRFLLSLPRVSIVDRWLEQADMEMSVTRFVGICLLLPVTAFLIMQVFRQTLFATFLFSGILAVAPLMWLSWMRSKRLVLLESQLADAVEFIARAMRAGHAFSTALQMVGDEGVQPIATEFRVTAEEVNYGVPLDAALQNLTNRFPSDDLRYFSTAVLLQRETGGNLAEILDNISNILRERYKLLGKVRVLAAEGKLSAYILIALPFGTAAMINLVAPSFMSVLWTDPAGKSILYIVGAMMTIGTFWMIQIAKIRI